MKEGSEHNLSAGDSQAGEQLDDEFIPAGARPLCPRCLETCSPLQYYCGKCDSTDAINPLTPYIGFVNIPFNYGIFITMWRKTWYAKDTRIIRRLVYLSMIAMFVPTFLVLGLPLLLVYRIPDGKLGKRAIIGLYIAAIALFIFFVRLQFWGIHVGGGLGVR